jgi:hypothetical protein
VAARRRTRRRARRPRRRTRGGDGLKAALRERLEERHHRVIDRPRPPRPGPLGELGDLIRWYGEAAAVFASRRGLPAPPASSTSGP